MVRAFLLVLFAYAAAGVIAVVSGILLRNQAPILVVGVADLAATIVIFLFSVMVRLDPAGQIIEAKFGPR